jgi:hypothetical protein
MLAERLVKKVGNGFVARIFCGVQGAGEGPISFAGLAARATSSTAKKVATPVGG